MKDKTNIWSEGLQQQTRDAISEMQVNPDGKLHFKNHGKGGAFITAQDLMHGKLSLTDKENGHVSDFANANALLDAGWVID